MPPPPPAKDGFVEALDSIARALAYTEKRVASAEARLLAAMNERAAERKQGNGQWGGGFVIFGGLVLLFLFIGLVVTFISKKKGTAGTIVGSQQVPMIVRAGPGPTPLVLSQPGPGVAMGMPPASFLS